MRLIEEHPERIGYLLKERVFDVAILVAALRRLADGETVIDPTIGARLVGRHRREDPLAELTQREREVLSLVAEGMSNRAIAMRLFVTERTVEAHIKQVFLKLGLSESRERHRAGFSRCLQRGLLVLQGLPTSILERAQDGVHDPTARGIHSGRVRGARRAQQRDLRRLLVHRLPP